MRSLMTASCKSSLFEKQIVRRSSRLRRRRTSRLRRDVACAVLANVVTLGWQVLDRAAARKTTIAALANVVTLGWQVLGIGLPVVSVVARHAAVFAARQVRLWEACGLCTQGGQNRRWADVAQERHGAHAAAVER
jgi:hypothetical protein